MRPLSLHSCHTPIAVAGALQPIEFLPGRRGRSESRDLKLYRAAHDLGDDRRAEGQRYRDQSGIGQLQRSGHVSVIVRDPDCNVIELRGRDQGEVEGVTRYLP